MRHNVDPVRRSRIAWLRLMALWLVLGVAWIALSRVRDNGAAEHGGSSSLPEKGFVAPDFTLEMLDGSETTLSDLQGQGVLINFWATWCPQCRDEMPAIQEVYEQYRDQGFIVLAVNVREGDAQVKGFIEQTELTFPILMDPDGTVGDRYGVRSIPTTFFVDHSGVIRDIVVGGPMSRALIESKVTDLLVQDERE
jgi:cytochrome c biogenesis protein CcmG/thiol:disulfide interchange protein DsbE